MIKRIQQIKLFLFITFIFKITKIKIILYYISNKL